MSQAKKTDSSVIKTDEYTYQVCISYHTMEIGDDGRRHEVKKPLTPILLYRLSRRNIEHSKLALMMLGKEGAPNDIDSELRVVNKFIDCCVVDKAVQEDLRADILAAYDLFMSDEVKEDAERFFDTWDLLKKIPKSK